MHKVEGKPRELASGDRVSNGEAHTTKRMRIDATPPSRISPFVISALCAGLCCFGVAHSAPGQQQSAEAAVEGPSGGDEAQRHINLDYQPLKLSLSDDL